jgi:hypothetical protein
MSGFVVLVVPDEGEQRVCAAHIDPAVVALRFLGEFASVEQLATLQGAMDGLRAGAAAREKVPVVPHRARQYELCELIGGGLRFIARGPVAHVATHALSAFQTAAELDEFLTVATPKARAAVAGREEARRRLADTAVIPVDITYRADPGHECAPVPHVTEGDEAA